MKSFVEGEWTKWQLHTESQSWSLKKPTKNAARENVASGLFYEPQLVGTDESLKRGEKCAFATKGHYTWQILKLYLQQLFGLFTA